MRMSFVVNLFLATCFLSSCYTASALPEYTDISQGVKYAVMDFPAMTFDHIIWRSDNVVVALQDEDLRPLRQPYAFEGDTQLRYLDLEQDSKCELTQYRYPTQLPDGRLGLIKWCVTDNAFTDASYMLAYDWKTGRLEQIVQNPLKHFDISGCFSWNPVMTRGIQAVSNGLTGTLNWLTRVGPEPVDITLHDENHDWKLSEDFEENGTKEGGMVSCPAWSPKQDIIGVFGSLDAMSVSGIARLDKPFQLFFLFPKTGESESVLSAIYLPKSLEWSPDGERLAFIGTLANKVYGVWIFNISTKSLHLIANGEYFKDLSWSPSSQELAVIWCNASACDRSEIRQYTLSQ